jgi:SnoaL-like domain
MKLDFVLKAFFKDQLDPTIRGVETRGFHSSLGAKRAIEFAVSWVEAWNSRDPDRIVAHYSEDVVFSSPLVRSIGGGNSNAIRGRVALRIYFGAVLRRFPSLRFRLRAVYPCDEAVILLHDSVNGLVAGERLKLDQKGQIIRAWVYYGRVKQSHAEQTDADQVH